MKEPLQYPFVLPDDMMYDAVLVVRISGPGRDSMVAYPENKPFAVEYDQISDGDSEHDREPTPGEPEDQYFVINQSPKPKKSLRTKNDLYGYVFGSATRSMLIFAFLAQNKGSTKSAASTSRSQS